MTLPKERLGVALAGCGRFGDFCLSAVADLPQLLPVGVSDTDRARALATAGRHGIAAHSDYAALLGDDRVDVVIIATPPADHAPMALAAIAAGKHVFCEKPLATSLPEATAVVQAARAHRVRLSVDYVLRWNPLYRLLRRLPTLSTPGGAPMLGRLRHFAFHNLARDDHLPPDHWFWDPEASGGIFVEHGVHFFDAAAWLLGSHPLEVQALEVPRAEDGPVDTAIAVARHPGGATATYTHIFAHPERAERQLTTLDWGFAHAVVSGWIPVELELQAWADPDGAALLLDLHDRADELLEVPGFRGSATNRSQSRSSRSTASPSPGAAAARGARSAIGCGCGRPSGPRPPKSTSTAKACGPALPTWSPRCAQTVSRSSLPGTHGRASPSRSPPARRPSRDGESRQQPFPARRSSAATWTEPEPAQARELRS
jgi:predicted dehydrogenase